MELDQIDLCKQAIKAMQDELNTLKAYETSNKTVALVLLQKEVELISEIERFKGILAELEANQ